MDESVANNNENFRECANSPKRRHWCVTAWLILVAIINIVLILPYGIIETNAFLIADVLFTLFCVILLARWNKWGFYLYAGAAYVVMIWSFVDYIASLFSSPSVQSVRFPSQVIGTMLGLCIIMRIFMLKGPDGRTSFENLGIRRYSKKKK